MRRDSTASEATRARRGRQLHATSLAVCGRLSGHVSADAISLIAGDSRGIPRLVNSICDNALLLAHAGGDSWITVDRVRQVLRDLDLTDRISRNTARLETEQLIDASSRPPVPIPEPFPSLSSGVPLIMRWASKLNLGTVQVAKTSQHLRVDPHKQATCPLVPLTAEGDGCQHTLRLPMTPDQEIPDKKHSWPLFATIDPC